MEVGRKTPRRFGLLLRRLARGSLPSPPAFGPRDFVKSLALFLLLLVCVTSFWGRTGLLLPPPLDNWHYVFFRGLARWSESVRQALRAEDSVTLYAGLEAFVLGLLAPASLLMLVFRRKPADLGLRWPDALGWRWTLAGMALSVPVGLGITALVPPRASHFAYVVGTLNMIPEHFLICSVGVALLLPARRLVYPPQPRAALVAVLGSAALFVAAHVGARPAELAFSAPLGVVFAYMTWRTASTWPALLVHWSLNLAPLGLRAHFG